MMAMGEDHFVGTVRHTVYTPGPFGTTTSMLKTLHLAFPRAPYTHGPDEFVEVSSDAVGAEEPEPEPAPEPDDVMEDPDYVPSEHSASSMSEDDSDDSGFTLSPDLPPSPEYHPGPMEDDLDYPATVHADGADPLAIAVAAAEEDPEEDDPDEYFHVPEEDVIIIDSPSDSDPEPSDSVVILSDSDV